MQLATSGGVLDFSTACVSKCDLTISVNRFPAELYHLIYLVDLSSHLIKSKVGF